MYVITYDDVFICVYYKGGRLRMGSLFCITLYMKCQFFTYNQERKVACFLSATYDAYRTNDG